MANQAIPNPGRALDLNGYVSPGAKYTVYLSGTTTLATVYADKEELTIAANPVIADANGVFPQRYVVGNVKIVVQTAANVTLYTLDPAPVVQSTGSGASQISFEPTVNVPQTNVQAAIEHVSNSVISGFATFGLGITGNATLLANLDATNTGAGVYRFAGTTTGTFPSGVLAADTGIVETWRQASGEAMMELGHITGDRVWRRRLTAGVWGAWREVVIANQGAVEGDILYRGATNWTRLAKGTALQNLRMNAGATAPEWNTPAVVQDRTLLATKTASASATLDFTEFNNATYRRYQFEIDLIKPATNAVTLQIRVSADGGATYNAGASDYEYSLTTMVAATQTLSGSGAATSIVITPALSNAAGVLPASGNFTLMAGAVSSEALVQGNIGAASSGGPLASVAYSGSRVLAQITNGLRFLFSAGNIASGTIRMYGII